MLTPEELKKRKQEELEKAKKISDSWCLQFVKEEYNAQKSKTNERLN